MKMEHIERPELLIIGGGPAGLSAAIVASNYGVRTLLVDEGVKLGGQLVKQTHKFFGDEEFYASKRGFEIADILIDEVKKSSNVLTLTQTSVIGIYEDAVGVYDRTKEKVFSILPGYILVAAGASERFLSFPGNDLPGVYGAGAVQTLVNQYGVLPGKRFLIVGSGNIGLILAYQLYQAGADVVAIVEITDRIGGYEVHAAKVKRLGIPVLTNHTLVRAIGQERVRGAVIAKVDEHYSPIPSTERELVVDVICLAVGLVPSVELVMQAGAELIYVNELGGYVPRRDFRMRTTVDNLFVAGDLAGIEEATTAMIEGKIAALTIVEELRNLDLSEEIERLQKKLSIFRSGPTSEKVRRGLEKMGIHYEGASFQNVKGTHGLEYKLKPVIECFQPIPCNPCETSCPTGAIVVGDNINNPPKIDYEKCTGCGICAISCPGLAIFMIQEDYKGNKSLIGVPYEFLPLPQKGDVVLALDRDGNIVSDAVVEKVIKSKNLTNLVYISIDRDLAHSVRQIVMPESKPVSYVCRCEDVTVEDVMRAIDAGFTDYEELRRYLRIGMGPCGGRTCSALALNLLARKTGRSPHELRPQISRPPIFPVPFASLKGGEKDEG